MARFHSIGQCQTLGLSNNQIGDVGITAFAQAIKPVSEGGSGALAQCLSLRLNDNLIIGDVGCSALANAFDEGAKMQNSLATSDKKFRKMVVSVPGYVNIWLCISDPPKFHVMFVLEHKLGGRRA